MKSFLLTCTGLMVLAGIYGATDMSIDMSNGRLIEYEHVRERHAEHLLAIMKTTGMKVHYKGSGLGAEQKKINAVAGEESKTEKKGMAEEKGRTASEMIEIFGRGDIEIVEAVPTTEELERFEAEQQRHETKSRETSEEQHVVMSAEAEK